MLLVKKYFVPGSRFHVPCCLLQVSGFLLASIFIFFSCTKKEFTIEEVINNTYEKYKNHSSVSYDIEYNQKYFSGDDTVKVNANCMLIRESNDTLFSGIVWFSTTDSIEKYYDLINIYSINHKDKSITEYSAHEDQTWAISGNTAGSVIKTYFLNPYKLKKIISDTTNKILLLDTTLNNEPFWIVKVDFPDEPPFISEMQKNIWIKKSNYNIPKITFRVKFQNNYQYNEWNLSNVEFDKIDKPFLDKKLESTIKLYTYEQYTEQEEKEYKPLENGTIAPDFKGLIYQENRNINLTDYKNQVVLLDFWYMSCYPCIQAIPHLSELFTKYNKKGLVVLGLNPFNNSEKEKEKFPDFIEINKMNYPIVLVNKEVAISYKVKAYPTFYIINKKGEIIFSQRGFGESMINTVDSIINREIE